MSNFDDIRPFNDAEAPAVIARLIENPELQRAVAALKFPILAKWLPWLVCPLVKRALNKQFGSVQTVRDMQEVIAGYMEGMMASKVTELTYSGIEKLEPGKSYLFISNHRDIAMDPAFMNLALYNNGFDTVRIAIGDNLLTKPYVSDLMRVNKSFIVNRSASGAREKFKASKHLSAYIHHSIVEEQSHIWIAQREGRAKDGLDATNSAIISMLVLSKPKKVEFKDYINELNIVPVSISYEWDPCDAAKANELHAHQEHGSYEKDEHEDVASIAAGIAGDKGHVHVAFGDVLQGDYENAEQVAKAIDQQVWDQYVLQPSNHLAYEMLHGKQESFPVGAAAKPFVASDHQQEAEHMKERLSGLPKAQQDILLGIYANPIISKLSV